MGKTAINLADGLLLPLSLIMYFLFFFVKPIEIVKYSQISESTVVSKGSVNHLPPPLPSELRLNCIETMQIILKE